MENEYGGSDLVAVAVHVICSLSFSRAPQGEDVNLCVGVGEAASI